MKRVVGMVVAGAALLGALVWGCASSTQTAFNEPRDWQTHEPDGGWQNYLPPKRLYDPDPFRTNRNSTPLPGTIAPDTIGTPGQRTPPVP